MNYLLNYERITSKNSKNEIQNVPIIIENISEKIQNDFNIKKFKK